MQVVDRASKTLPSLYQFSGFSDGLHPPHSACQYETRIIYNKGAKTRRETSCRLLAARWEEMRSKKLHEPRTMAYKHTLIHHNGAHGVTRPACLKVVKELPCY